MKMNKTIMKRTVTIAGLCFILATVQAKNIHDLFEKYADNERFTYVSVGKGATNLLNKFADADGVKIITEDLEFFSKINNIKILSLESETDEKLMNTILLEVNEIIKSEKFEPSAEGRSKGEQVSIYAKKMDQNVAEVLIVVKNKEELSLIWLNGDEKFLKVSSKISSKK